MKNTTNAAQLAKGMSAEILENSQGINNVLTTSCDVKAVFHTHYANMESSEYGIAALICQILRDAGAIFPTGAEATELRSQVLANGLLTEQIFNQVQARFSAGSNRYPMATVKTYLSVFMVKSGIVSKAQMTGGEDSERTCPKPRCKWYLIKQ